METMTPVQLQFVALVQAQGVILSDAPDAAEEASRMLGEGKKLILIGFAKDERDPPRRKQRSIRVMIMDCGEANYRIALRAITRDRNARFVVAASYPSTPNT